MATAPASFLDPALLARISDLALLARTVVDGFMHGLHRSAKKGLSLDFAEHRHRCDITDLADFLEDQNGVKYGQPGTAVFFGNRHAEHADFAEAFHVLRRPCAVEVFDCSRCELLLADAPDSIDKGALFV